MSPTAQTSGNGTSASRTMKAIGLSSAGKLVDMQVTMPHATDRQLLVRVKAIAVNPVDTKQPAPKGEADDPRILGYDVAGVVEAVGPSCQLFKPGDEVYYAGDITKPGGNSEYHVVDERIVGHKPKSIDFAHAAAMPLTSITAWEGLFDRMRIPMSGNDGKSILIIGAAGGVGSIATQLAKYAGLTVIGTASRSESESFARTHGTDIVMDHRKPFLPQLKEHGLNQVDYVFCTSVVHQHWENILEALRPQGHVCTILPPQEPLNFRDMQDKSITWTIELMFSRAKHQTEDMVRQHQLLTELATLIDAGDIVSTMTERLKPIHATNLQIAFDRVREGHMLGKIVLEDFV